jgi:hypothetical protein
MGCLSGSRLRLRFGATGRRDGCPPSLSSDAAHVRLRLRYGATAFASRRLVEAAGVELFHTLWFLQPTDSKKVTKCPKVSFAGVIVRVSYTENRANFAEMNSASTGFLHSICWFPWSVIHFRQYLFELFKRALYGTLLQLRPIGGLPMCIIRLSIVIG